VLRFIAFFLLLTALSSSTTALASVAEYKQAISAFQKSKASLQSKIDTLEQQFELNMTEIDNSYTSTSIAIEIEAANALAQIDTAQLPQMAVSQKVIDTALASLSTAGAVEVLKDLTAPRGFSAHSGAENYLSCLPFANSYPVTKQMVIKWPCANRTIDYPLPLKISKWDPTGSLILGTEWRTGDTTTIFINYGDKDYRGHLVGVDQMISAGEIKPTNITEFNRVSTTLKTEPLTLANLKSKYERDKNSVLVSKQNKLSANSDIRASKIDELEEELTEKKQEMQALQDLDELGILAAKRAGKNNKDFNKEFSVAFVFEHNRQQLELIADGELGGDLNYRSISTLAKVLILLDSADAIASKYDYLKASRFNTVVGSAFTKDIGFRTTQKYVVSKYQKATSKKITF
jgi:DNA repair exonuclease SbcCD ATPase subunit